MECPRCKSASNVKDGIVKGRQRYLCKQCRYRFTVEQRGKPTSIKRLALMMYLEGLSFRSIERTLKVSHVTVMNWIKAFGVQLDEYRTPERNIEIIEIDEVHSYVQQKKTTAGDGFLLIGWGEDSSTSCLVQGGPKRG